MFKNIQMFCLKVFKYIQIYICIHASHNTITCLYTAYKHQQLVG